MVKKNAANQKKQKAARAAKQRAYKQQQQQRDCDHAAQEEDQTVPGAEMVKEEPIDEHHQDDENDEGMDDDQVKDDQVIDDHSSKTASAQVAPPEEAPAASSSSAATETASEDADDEAVVPQQEVTRERVAKATGKCDDAIKCQVVPEIVVEDTSKPSTNCHKSSNKDSPNGAKRADLVKIDKKTAPPASQAKHPLENTWTFWYYQGDKTKSWYDNLLEVLSVDSVEDFWSLFNCIVEPSYLSPGKDYNFFKKGIKPEWEDPQNGRGGMWSVTLRERRGRTSAELSCVWRELLLLLVGNVMDASLGRFVNGVSYSARKNQDRVSVWIGADIRRNGQSVVQAIGDSLSAAIRHSGYHCSLEFATSDDWKNRKGSTITPRLTVHV